MEAPSREIRQALRRIKGRNVSPDTQGLIRLNYLDPKTGGLTYLKCWQDDPILHLYGLRKAHRRGGHPHWSIAYGEYRQRVVTDVNLPR